jgi:DNA repair exonuclease SbcCD ATPase subunit
MAEQEQLQSSLKDLKQQGSQERNWTDTRLQERDSLYKSLAAATIQIQTLEKELLENGKLMEQQKQAMASTKSTVGEGDFSAEFDALFLRVNELEYKNARLKDELEATLSLAQEREAILEKRLKSSLKETTRMASRMTRYKKRKNFFDNADEERIDNMAIELEESRARLKEMDEVNRALLAQLQANNNYLGHNISKRDQYKQELTQMKTGMTKLELENDSLRFVVQHGLAFSGPRKDSIMAYQEKIYKLEQKIKLTQTASKDQISRLNQEILSLKSDVQLLSEERMTLAQVKKVEASRSQLSDDRERKLAQLELQLQEKDLTLRQKEKVIQDKLKEIEQQEKKYQDMQKWEEELHLLERKLKINPSYLKTTKTDN